MSERGEFQSNEGQYKMPPSLRKKRTSSYRVGYTASTGNETGNKSEPGKRSDWEN
ncbi:hypothetical protein [Mesobacillus harenae]|uniref:hypothetical protein n=1 Tax=Mesobacillus harenae TaxID=2213203 RepID=UPI0015809DA5|nr:hypothetical protein [Mesobacillus harenae]